MPTEIMDARKKRAYGIACFIPLVCWILLLGYHFLIFRPMIARMNSEDYFKLHEETAKCYNMLLILYSIVGIITLIVLLLLIVHILKIKNMTIGSKTVWCVVLAVFIPVSFVVFWYNIIHREPRQLEVNRTIDGD